MFTNFTKTNNGIHKKIYVRYKNNAIVLESNNFAHVLCYINNMAVNILKYLRKYSITLEAIHRKIFTPFVSFILQTYYF